MSSRPVVLFAGVLCAAIALLPATAWAPPICAGTQTSADRLTLRVHSVTVDGVALDATNLQQNTSYFLQSGCHLDALAGVLAAPDAVDLTRSIYLGRVAP